MHNHYYLLQQLALFLDIKLKGFTLVSCFSQNKDELVLEFNDSQSSFFIKASLQPEFQCLSFPASFHRARKNSVDLFDSLLMKKVERIYSFDNERAFAVALEEENIIVFKMHGARANVVWLQNDTAAGIFRNNLTGDLELHLSSLNRPIDWSYETFKKNQQDLPTIYFTFGKPVWEFLDQQNFQNVPIEQRWKLFNEVRLQLKSPSYYLVEKDGDIRLTLLATSNATRYSDPVTALNEFYHRRISNLAFQQEKVRLASHLNGRLKQSHSFLEKNKSKLDELENDAHYQQWADLLMAHLHELKPGMEIVTVKNFYNQDQPVEIKLKADLTPQKNAEVYYRKGKNQSIELATLRNAIERKESEVQQLLAWQKTVNDAQDIRELKNISPSILKDPQAKEQVKSLPYKAYEYKGYAIWVGKNASANDELTLKYSYKDDLWLHAKDVAGSHVLIKHQAGKNFPKDVIERGAALAAYYSKRKNEGLCPVAYTSKKYVRKRKGDPAGAVVVEREEVILVTPQE